MLYVAVRAANLYTYAKLRALREVQLLLRLETRNGNAHSVATFSHLECRLVFVGETLAVLRADPFHMMPARGSLPLAFVASTQDA